MKTYWVPGTVLGLPSPACLLLQVSKLRFRELCDLSNLIQLVNTRDLNQAQLQSQNRCHPETNTENRGNSMETCGNWEASGFHKLSICKVCSSPGSHTAVQLSAHNKDPVRLVCVCLCRRL